LVHALCAYGPYAEILQRATRRGIRWSRIHRMILAMILPVNTQLGSKEIPNQLNLKSVRYMRFALMAPTLKTCNGLHVGGIRLSRIHRDVSTSISFTLNPVQLNDCRASLYRRQHSINTALPCTMSSAECIGRCCFTCKIQSISNR